MAKFHNLFHALKFGLFDALTYAGGNMTTQKFYFAVLFFLLLCSWGICLTGLDVANYIQETRTDQFEKIAAMK